MNSTSKTRFNFFRGNHGQLVGCMAYRTNTENNIFEYEVSTHNPKDEYSREKARFVAEGRLNKHPRILAASQDTSLPQCLKEAFENLYDCNEIGPRPVPNRLKRAIKLRLSFLAEKELIEKETKAKILLEKGFVLQS